MRANYRTGECWRLKAVKICIRLTVFGRLIFPHFFSRMLPSTHRIYISLLVSLDTTHDKKVSSSLGTCLTDLPSWLRSQASRSGRQNVCESLYAFAVCSQVCPYFIVLTAEVEVVSKKKKSRERRYSNEDVFMCISKVDCQRHIHTAARIYT